MIEGAGLTEELRAKLLDKQDEDLSCPSFSGIFRPILMDITIVDLNLSDNVGIRTTQYIQQSLRNHPLLGDLALLLKSFLSAIDLNNTYKGNRSSYR